MIKARAKRYIKKSLMVVAITALFLLPFITFSIAVAESDTELESRKRAYEIQAEEARQKAAEKKKDADYLQEQVYGLDVQIAETESALINTRQNINGAQSKIDQLADQIKEQEEQLEIERQKKNKIVSAWYMEGGKSLLMTLFQPSLTAAFENEEHYQSIEEQIQIAQKKIEELKNQLQGQKNEQDTKMAELRGLEDEQESYKVLVESRRSTRKRLFNSTYNQQQEYLANVEQYKKEIANISAELYRRREEASRSSNEGISHGGSGYLYSCGYLDQWGFFTCQCTSYAAWYWNARLRKSWINTRPGMGSAWNWPALANDQGYSVSSTPIANAIVSWPAGSETSGWGHVAIVEKVNGDGTIEISEFNWSPPLGYSYRTNVNPYNYGTPRFIY